MNGSIRVRRRQRTTLLTRLAMTAGLLLASTGAAIAVATPAHATVVQNAVAGNGAVSATVSCPAGEFLTGAGGRIIGGGGNITLTSAVPNLAAASVTVKGHNNPTGSPNYIVVAQAICLQGPPPANYQLVQNTSAGVAASHNVVATCPGATKLLGTGFNLAGVGGQALGGQAFLRWSLPNFALTSNTVIADNAFGFGGAWQATSYAICATPPGATTRVAQAFGSTPANSKSAVTNGCPGNSRTTGVGGAASGAIAGFVLLDQITTNQAQTQATSKAVEALNPGAMVAWDLDAFNICWAP